MATLTLLRHLKSAWDVPGQADFDRPLAPRGRKAGRLLAQHIARQGVRPELILCSAALRTRQTLEAVGATWRDVDTCIERGLYEASDANLLRRLRQVSEEVGSVLLIGHNPGLERLALALCAGRGDAAALESLATKFPTGALATLACDTVSWPDLGNGKCRLESFVQPKNLH